MDRRSALSTKIGFSVLAFNSALAIRNSRGDAASVAFVLTAHAALVLLFLCLRSLERALGGDGAARNNMAGPYSALARVALAVMACNAAIDAYEGRHDALSAALVLACFSGLVILMGLFVREFAGAHVGGHGQGN
ncbi:unnamed protein product [Urochloa decumbens]|uniref:Uncharacterized protein n=1 Tax=Urochloa decumbens TaxID=240449 RepID=A0ABC9DW74_9POAL